MKERLDVILVEQGYAPSREKAKAIIMSGNVYVNGQKEDKAGTGFDVSKIKLEVRNHTMKYVSRGGLKLEKAMEQWGFLLDGMICMDIGASTGGFTDCMLQNGATKVYSVDVGQGQLAWKLRNDERVVCMEQTNFRYVTPEDIPDALDFASVDVSFISLTKILIPARNLLKTGGQMVCLIKPQFEAGRGKVKAPCAVAIRRHPQWITDSTALKSSSFPSSSTATTTGDIDRIMLFSFFYKGNPLILYWGKHQL